MQFEGRYSNENWNAQLDSGATWRDVLWLKSITHLPIIIKGILTSEYREYGSTKIILYSCTSTKI